MFLDGFYTDPMLYVGALFAIAGAVAFGFFVAGVFPGFPHIFSLSGHEEHQNHYRHRAIFGLTFGTATFIVWVGVRIVASWFGYPPPNTGAFSVFMVSLIIVLCVAGIIVLVKKSLGSAHH